MAINEGIGLERLAYFVEIGEYLAENGASKIPGPGVRNMERDLGESWIEFKRDLESIRAELGLKPRDIRDTGSEVRAILEGTGFFEREKWIRAGGRGNVSALSHSASPETVNRETASHETPQCGV